MSILHRIIALSKKTAKSFLDDENPTDLENSELFGKEDKRKFLTRLTDKSEIDKRTRLVNQIDNERAWKTLENVVGSSRRTSMYWTYGIAASFVVIIASAYLIVNKKPLVDNSTPVDTKIEIGTDKATLTLGNGTDIPLEKGTTYRTDNANSNGEELVYNTNRNFTTEVVYNYLSVPRGGQFFVQLSDSTKVWLNSDSRLKYPVTFNKGETREVELVYGEAYFEVSPSSAHKGATFKVINRQQEVEVLGTEFNVKAYRDEDHVYTTLVEGKVAVSNMVTTQMLTPEQQSKLDLKSNTITIQTVDTYNETLWKKGRFWFKAKPLNEIMIVLGRWYDVNVVFDHEELKNVEFTGVLSKNQNIEDILKIFLNTNFINAYDIKDKKITIK